MIDDLPTSAIQTPPDVAVEQPTNSLQATPTEIIRLEANFLQFPFFALDTHGLKELDGLTCTAERQIGDERHEVTVRVTRNNAYAFPGPLSRKIHFALLAKLQDEQPHPPYRNPITWSWYDLAERIGLKQCSGRDIRQMKEAIDSTLAAFIKTRYSLRQTDDREQTLPKRESGYHLYERCAFTDETLPDGSIADTNYLWLSDWYLGNLNNHHCGPLDYGRWLFLNNESRIASRLYEYLSFNFSAGMPRFRIRYDRLAQFLPVTVCSSLSRARQQLEPALKLIQRQQVIDSFRFERGTSGDLLLVFEPGTVLRPGKKFRDRDSLHSGSYSERINPPQSDTPETTTEKSSLNDAAELVRSFYERWINSSEVTPSAKELDLAREQLAAHGQSAAELLAVVVKIMRQQFPDAQNFGATRTYWARAAATRMKKSVSRADQEKTALVNQQEQRDRSAKQEQKEQLRRVWRELGHDEQQRITAVVRSEADNEYVRRAIDRGNLTDPLVELACLKHIEPDAVQSEG